MNTPNFEERLASQKKFTSEELAAMNEIEQKALARYKGDLTELESALGMLRLGYHLGWRSLYIVHSKATIRKYEKLLDISIRETFTEEGPSACRHLGLQLAKKIGNFWKVVSGEKPIPSSEKRKLES